MFKKIFILILILISMNSIHALTISDYNVPYYIPLNKTLTVEGRLDQNLSNIRCVIRIYDADAKLIDRLTDEFTTSGLFSSAWYQITEPKFLRDENYIAQTNCGDAVAISSFQVIQKEGFGHFVEQESLFYTSEGNLNSFAYFILFVMVVAVLFIGGMFAVKAGWHFGSF